MEAYRESEAGVNVSGGVSGAVSGSFLGLVTWLMMIQHHEGQRLNRWESVYRIQQVYPLEGPKSDRQRSEATWPYRLLEHEGCFPKKLQSRGEAL